jgi:hypothetical protein
MSDRVKAKGILTTPLNGNVVYDEKKQGTSLFGGIKNKYYKDGKKVAVVKSKVKKKNGNFSTKTKVRVTKNAVDDRDLINYPLDRQLKIKIKQMKDPMMKKGMAYKKSMAYKMKTNQDGGSYTAKNPGAAAGQLKKDQSVATKYGSPTHKSDKRIAQDYARNAEADGNTAAGRYEAKKAVEAAAMKKGTPMHKDGAMKGDQSATRTDYSMDKGGTDKGYKGTTGSSKGDQSASQSDYSVTRRYGKTKESMKSPSTRPGFLQRATKNCM